MAKAPLSQRHCEKCQPGSLHIQELEAIDLESELHHAWKRDSTSSIRRDFSFRNFRGAFGFATRVALLAEEQGHHPDMEIGWGYVNITLTTHAAKGLTENDFIMAAKIDKIAQHEPLKES